jgi:glycosyltransferase involved in cell wall biosynthesis
VAVRVALDVSAVPAQVAGAGRYVVEIARRLPGAGVSTTLVARRDDTARWREWSPDARVVGAVPRARPARLAYEAWLLGVGGVARGADVWHGPHYTMPHRGRMPTVVTIHDLTFFTNPEWHERTKVTFFRRAIVYAARHARVLVSVSDFSARLLDEIVPEHAPVVVAPLGVDLVAFGPEDDGDAARLAASGLDPSAPVVLFVGTVEPRKGLDVLLSAFADVATRDGDVELWLAGQAGWGEGPIAAQLASHPFARRIRRLGFVEDAALPALYRRARAVAYPSRGEGFGLPVLEALACGASVVTTAETVMAEVAGGTARLVPAGDAAALAAAVLAALEEGPDERAARASRARERAEGFTWESCVTQHLYAYRRAVEGG